MGLSFVQGEGCVVGWQCCGEIVCGFDLYSVIWYCVIDYYWQYGVVDVC